MRNIAIFTIAAFLLALVTTALYFTDVLGFQDSAILMLLAVVVATLGTKET